MNIFYIIKLSFHSLPQVYFIEISDAEDKLVLSTGIIIKISQIFGSVPSASDDEYTNTEASKDTRGQHSAFLWKRGC